MKARSVLEDMPARKCSIFSLLIKSLLHGEKLLGCSYKSRNEAGTSLVTQEQVDELEANIRKYRLCRCR